ncbi:MAG: hypothetical protein LQ350_007335 [Teloschistes chrysophthalmus]|nr:MAG: hypothetical protein LQ350_007335 [Niorma chrysophthalma]
MSDGQRHIAIGPVRVLTPPDEELVEALRKITAKLEATSLSDTETVQSTGYGRIYLQPCYGQGVNSTDLEEGEEFTILPPCRKGCSMHRRSIIVGTDGACRDNGKPTAKAAYGVYFGKKSHQNHSYKIVRGGRPTSQRAELRACIEALVTIRNIKNAVACGRRDTESLHQVADDFPPVIIKSESAYLVEGMTKHINRWKGSGYLNAQGKPLVNGDYFMRIDQEIQSLQNLGIDVSFWRVPKDRNQEANKLANAAFG